MIRAAEQGSLMSWLSQCSWALTLQGSRRPDSGHAIRCRIASLAMEDKILGRTDAIDDLEYREAHEGMK